MNTEPKSGYKTTEFWITLVSGFVVVLGAIKPGFAAAHGEEINAAAAQIVGGVFALAAVVSAYANSRGKAKGGY